MEIAFPLHFPPKAAYRSLRMSFHQQLQPGFDSRPFCAGSGVPHRFSDQLVVNLNICSHLSFSDV